MRTLTSAMVLAAIQAALAHSAEPTPSPDVTVPTPAVRPSSPREREEPAPVEFEKLKFADEKLRLQAKAAQAWAESFAEKDWVVEGYRDVGYRSHPRLVANWGTSKVSNHSELRRHLPYRAVGILLEGWRDSDQRELIRDLHINGYWMPTKGWGARVSIFCGSSRLDEPQKINGTVMVTLVGKEQLSSFDVPPAAFPLTYPTFSARANEGQHFAYSYTAVLPTPSRDELRTELLTLYESPESMRDAALKDLDELRQLAKRQITVPMHLVVTDSTIATAAEPPVDSPADFHPPKAETTAHLLEQIESKIATREAIVREHFREMHAAIQKALPLDDLAMPLFGE